MGSNYVVARWLFFGAWLGAVSAVYMFLRVLSNPARQLWTALAAGGLWVILLSVYANLCPTFALQPTNLSFGSSDDLYSLRITNRTDADLYANAFAFRLASDLYSANDFQLRPAPQFLKPLEQQSAPAQAPEKVSDVLGMAGREASDRPVLIIYIYHLTPHESLVIGLKFEGYVFPMSPVKLTGRVLSYSIFPLPVSKKRDIVAIPLGVRRTLMIDGIAPCFLSDGLAQPCAFHATRLEGELKQAGCYYIAFVKGHDLPGAIPNPNSGSCDIGNFKTRNFSIW